MPDDLVERLRKLSKIAPTYGEAADELDRLREQNKALADGLTKSQDDLADEVNTSLNLRERLEKAKTVITRLLAHVALEYVGARERAVSFLREIEEPGFREQVRETVADSEDILREIEEK
jgi:ABC-type transporter Mla subunit MlaD